MTKENSGYLTEEEKEVPGDIKAITAGIISGCLAALLVGFFIF